VRKLFRVVAQIFKWNSLRDHTVDRIAPGILTIEELRKAKEFWIKYAQSKEEDLLRKSASSSDKDKVLGPYRRLAVFKDIDDIWRVGHRVKEYAPFTADRKAPAFIPRKSRLAFLLMEQAHRRKHSGVEETVAQFRLGGYWTTEAAKLAKMIRSRCVTCRILDKRPIDQLMGEIPKQQLMNPSAWCDVELDLFGPLFAEAM